MKARELRLLVAFVAVLTIIGVSYAVTQITISNTSNIVSGISLFINQPQKTMLSCPAHNDPTYIKNPTSLFWNMTAGGPAVTYLFCIDNQGSAPDTLSITSTLTQGQCPAPAGGTSVLFGGASGAPTTLAAGAATTVPVTISVCAGPGVATGAGPAFTISIT